MAESPAPAPVPPTPEEYVECLRGDSAALAAAAAAAGLDAEVPSCPDWTVADLLGHIGRVQHWAAAVVGRRATEPLRFRDLPSPPEPAERLDWARAGARELADTLASVDPATPVWTFVVAGRDAGRAAFWQRRQALEAAVHRYDAQLAAGDPAPVDGALAVDGIDELLTVLAPATFGPRCTGAGESVHLHCTDRPGEWLLRFTAGGLEVERMHAKGDVAVRGPASDLFLLVHNRRRADGLEVFGDPTVLDRWHEAARL